MKEYYLRKGIKKLYQWQAECLFDADVLAGKNIVIALPTSGGKTLIAEISVLRYHHVKHVNGNTLYRCVLLKKKKAIVILPCILSIAAFIAVVNNVFLNAQ